MPITDFQREQRSRHIGSSDAAAILGLDPWRSAYDVWLEKTGKLQPSETVNEAAEIGTMIEDSLLDWAAAETGIPIIKNQRRVAKDAPLAANHDALARDLPVGFEAKTTGILSPVAKHLDAWGEAGTDQVPDRVLIQCHHQMIVSDLSVVWVPALIGGRGRVLYEVKRSGDLAEALRLRLSDWWEMHVVQGRTPADSVPSFDSLKRVRREPASVTAIPDALVAAWLEAKAAAKAAEKVEEDARKAMLTALGEAEAGDCALGRLTYLPQTRSSLDTKRLRAAHPAIAEEFTSAATFPVLRFKEAKT